MQTCLYELSIVNEDSIGCKGFRFSFLFCLCSSSLTSTKTETPEREIKRRSGLVGEVSSNSRREVVEALLFFSEPLRFLHFQHLCVSLFLGFLVMI